MLASAALLAGCGSSGSTGSPRGTVSAFDADLSSHAYVAACKLLEPSAQAVIIGADASSQSHPSCASALASAGAQRELSNLRIPASGVGTTTVSDQAGGTVALQSDKPVPVTYTLAEQHGRWLISEF